MTAIATGRHGGVADPESSVASEITLSSPSAIHRARRIARSLITVGAVGAAALVPVGGAVAAAHGHHRPAPFGTVVDWRGASHTATVAGRTGRLFAIHTNRRVAIGTIIAVRHLRQLHNGTYVGGIVRLGHTRHARIRGVVVATVRGHGFAIGARGTTFVVRSRAHNTTLNALSSSRAPFVGESVVTDVQIDPHGALTEIDVHTTSAAIGSVVEIEGILTAVDPVGGTITIAHEDDGTVTSYTVIVPPTVDLSTLVIGQEMHVLGSPNPDGTFSLAVVPQTLHIEGTVSAIDTTANTITVTTTDDGMSMTFVVNVPTTVDIGSFSVGSEVELDVVQNADGSFSLVQSSDNGDSSQADDQGNEHSGGNDNWSPAGATGGDAARRGA